MASRRLRRSRGFAVRRKCARGVCTWSLLERWHNAAPGVDIAQQNRYYHYCIHPFFLVILKYGQESHVNFMIGPRSSYHHPHRSSTEGGVFLLPSLTTAQEHCPCTAAFMNILGKAYVIAHGPEYLKINATKIPMSASS